MEMPCITISRLCRVNKNHGIKGCLKYKKYNPDKHHIRRKEKKT